MPEVDKIFTKYRDRGFVALGISIDEDTKKVAPFLKKKPVGYPIHLDNLSTPSWAAFKVRAIPALFLIDRKGNIVAQWRGEVKPALVDAAIAEQLSK